jgi:hypothetical protein
MLILKEESSWFLFRERASPGQPPGTAEHNELAEAFHPPPIELVLRGYGAKSPLLDFLKGFLCEHAIFSPLRMKLGKSITKQPSCPVNFP